MTQIGKKFVVMKPSMWMICHGPIHDNFLSWWQPHMLIIWQPDKLLKDLRNSKGSRELTAVWKESLVSCVNHNVLNLMFSLYMSRCLAKVQDTAMSLLHCSPSPCFLQWRPSPIGLVQFEGGQYLHKFCSVSTVGSSSYWKQHWNFPCTVAI